VVVGRQPREPARRSARSSARARAARTPFPHAQRGGRIVLDAGRHTVAMTRSSPLSAESMRPRAARVYSTLKRRIEEAYRDLGRDEYMRIVALREPRRFVSMLQKLPVVRRRGGRWSRADALYPVSPIESAGGLTAAQQTLLRAYGSGATVSATLASWRLAAESPRAPRHSSRRVLRRGWVDDSRVGEKNTGDNFPTGFANPIPLAYYQSWIRTRWALAFLVGVGSIHVFFAVWPRGDAVPSTASSVRFQAPGNIRPFLVGRQRGPSAVSKIGSDRSRKCMAAGRERKDLRTRTRCPRDHLACAQR
jgi:hypothetical protein